MYKDLREFIEQVDALHALRRIEGADAKFEIGGITEVAAGRPDGPALAILRRLQDRRWRSCPGLVGKREDTGGELPVTWRLDAADGCAANGDPSQILLVLETRHTAIADGRQVVALHLQVLPVADAGARGFPAAVAGSGRSRAGAERDSDGERGQRGGSELLMVGHGGFLVATVPGWPIASWYHHAVAGSSLERKVQRIQRDCDAHHTFEISNIDG
jgi:hypothetical protein